MRISVIYILFFVFAFTACKSKKAPLVSDNKEETFKSVEEKYEFENYFYQAINAKAKNEFNEAISFLKKCLAMKPNFAVVHYELSKCYIENNNVELIKYHAEKAAELEPKNPYFIEHAADVFGVLKNHTKAIKYYEAFLKLKPEKREVYHKLAIEYNRNKNYEEVIKTYNRLEAMIGIDAEVIKLKETMFLRMGKPDKAADELKKLLEKYPKNTDYMGMLAELYFMNKQEQKAAEIYLKIIEIEPKNGKAHFGLATYYRNKNDSTRFFGELELAFEDSEVSLKEKVNTLVSIIPLAEEDIRYKALVFKMAEIIVNAHPSDPLALDLYADLMFNDRQWINARKYYHRSLLLSEGNPKVFSQMLAIDMQLKDNYSMEALSEQALSLYPEYLEFYYYQIYSLYGQKKYDKAIKTAEEALAQGNTESVIEPLIYGLLAEIYYDLNDYKKCFETFEEALMADPNNATNLNNYAYRLSLQNIQLTKAESMAKQAIELKKNNAAFLDTYGLVLFKLKKYKEAEIQLAKALNIDSSNAEILEHYGDVLYFLDRKTEAFEYWNKAKNENTANETLSKKIAQKQYFEN